MRRLGRLLALFALLLAPFAPAMPAMAAPVAEAAMADCHDAAPAPAKSDCCDHTGSRDCCPGALAVLRAVAAPLATASMFADWPSFEPASTTRHARPLDDPPRA